jgi:hypothetical protein
VAIHIAPIQYQDRANWQELNCHRSNCRNAFHLDFFQNEIGGQWQSERERTPSPLIGEMLATGAMGLALKVAYFALLLVVALVVLALSPMHW